MNKYIDSFIDGLAEELKLNFRTIAQHAVELGCRLKPGSSKQKGSKQKQITRLLFMDSHSKKYVLRLDNHEAEPQVKLKFFAAQHYPKTFEEAIRNTIEEFSYKYTSCYGCGRCKGTPKGYHYTYPDGRTYFRCGSELIELGQITQQHVADILSLLDKQYAYYMQS